ncbi:MAG TPA: YciI family protein [Flavisolibacter sp.]|jgi:hypothetical protein|nr:YciI family protein [Flavisolibacter sp.]
MKEFLLIFRTGYNNTPERTPEEASAVTLQWMDWIKTIAIENKLVDRGNRLNDSGRVLKSKDVITNGPYTEIKETIGGYTLIKAESYDDAIKLSEDCPILSFGGTVEIREINPL